MNLQSWLVRALTAAALLIAAASGMGAARAAADDVGAVSVGGSFACAQLGSAAQCWGDGAGGQLGTGSSQELTPATVPLAGAAVQQVSAGGDHACALISDGTVQCWGSDSTGQLGTAAGGGEGPVAVAG